ncbi:MerR family DNA-binding transcriptional regulator [Streptomyces sp. NPDC055239]
MRIGELSERTGPPRRLLRYYEEQGLIMAGRAANGYRECDERFVDRVVQIRGRVACLTRNRDAIAEYLDAVRDGSPPDVTVATAAAP